MSKQHTPYRFDHEWFQIVDSKNNVIADYVNEDKAELILKAVNNHDRLVEALEETSKALRSLSVLAIDDCANPSDADKAYKQYEKAKQLLTELKS